MTARPLAGTSGSTRQIARAALLVMSMFLISRVLGLVREMIIGARFGTSAQLDAYQAAFRVPDLLFQLIAGGALVSAFLPVFTGCLTRRDLKGAWRLFSAATNLVVILLTTLAAVMAFLAPWLVHNILAPGFSPPQQALTAELVRWMLISTVIFGVSGIVMGVLNSFQHFLLPALAPILYNLSIIAGAWFLAPTLGVYGLVLGVVVGAALHLDAQMFGLWWYGGRYTFTLGLKDPKVHEVARLMGPRVVGLAAVQVNFWVNTLLASSLVTGSLAALNYAWLLMLLPQGIVAQSVATAAFPTFASLQAQGRWEELSSTITATLRGILFLAIPAAIGLLVWRVPLVRVLLERGEFTAESTRLTSSALAFFSLGLIGHSAVEILARAFYALHDTRTPVIVAVSTMALNTVLSLLLRLPLAHAGLALANTIAVLLEMGLLFVLLSRQIGGLDWSGFFATVLKTSIAAVAMGMVLYWMTDRFADGSKYVVGIGGLMVGALVFLLVAFALRTPELSTLTRLLPRRPVKAPGA